MLYYLLMVMTALFMKKFKQFYRFYLSSYQLEKKNIALQILKLVPVQIIMVTLPVKD